MSMYCGIDLHSTKSWVAVLDEELDRILARIGEVGLEGLEPRERRILERASRERRKTGS